MMMLAEESTPRHNKHNLLLPLKIIQHGVDTTFTLHLQYMDTVLTVRNSIPHHSMVALSLQSAVHFITEAQALSPIYCTFRTLFHQSLVSPKRPLTQHRCTPIPLSGKSRTDKVRCGRKVRRKSSDNKMHSKLMENQDREQEELISSLQSPSRATQSPYFPGWNSRRHSIIVANSRPRLPLVAPADRRLTRRCSIGLVSPNKCEGFAFPATVMYAKIVSHLETNLESTRHFYRLQKFNNCFCGQRLVNCLMAYCISSLNSCITKEKASEMCRRLLSHGVIENVSHKKQQGTEGTVFKCGRLYRFTGNHFWEENGTTASSELEQDGGKHVTSASMPSLSSSMKSPGQSSIRKICTSFSERKTGFVRSCKTRFSLRGTNTI